MLRILNSVLVPEQAPAISSRDAAHTLCVGNQQRSVRLRMAIRSAASAMRMIRATLPEHGIVLAASGAAATIASYASVVADRTPAHELRPSLRAPYEPEIGIDLHGNGAASRQLLVDARARRVVSYATAIHQTSGAARPTIPPAGRPARSSPENRAPGNAAWPVLPRG